MKAAFKLLLCAGLFSLLQLQAIKAAGDDDFHTKFGKEIGTAMLEISIRMLEANVKNAEDFYKNLLIDLKPDEEQTNKINKMLTGVKEMEEKLLEVAAGKDASKIITFFKDFMINQFMKIIRMDITDMAKNEEQLKTLSMAIGDFAAMEGEAGGKAIKELYDKWSEMYKTIPAEEMQAHSEYAKINESMLTLINIDRAHMKYPRQQNDALRELLMRMANFFNWDEWNNILEIKEN